MVDLELYRIFYEVAKAGNITQASNILNISQPAVTKHIKNLEAQIGSPLFYRSRKGVVLNDSGKKLYKYIKQALELITIGEQQVNEYRQLKKGTLKMGVSTTLTKKYLLKYIEEYHKKYPNIIIEISTDPTCQLKEKLRDGQIDFIIAKMPEEKEYDLDYIELGKLEDIFVVNKDYKKLIGEKVTIEELIEYPILLQKEPSSSRELIEQYFKDNNIKMKSTMNIASSNLLIDFVKIGFGVGVTTKEYVKEELNNKELFIVNVTPKLKTRNFGIIKLKDNILTYSAQEMMNLLSKK